MILRENHDNFERHGVDSYLKSYGLVVDRIYRGCGIAEQLLRARTPICKEFGIKLTLTIFTSDTLNRIADKVGFKLDKTLGY